jgi:inorganic pyrophosphatase
MPTSIVTSRPIGVVLTQDQDGTDSIIAVPTEKVDPSFSNITDINDISNEIREKLEHFIEHHKDLEKGKFVKMLGWKCKDEAKQLIIESSERYNSEVQE